MKQVFSTDWKSGKNRRKQRKYLANAPLHIRAKFIASHLSKALKEKYNTRSLRVRKGDKVKILRGQHKGKIGTIDQVNLKKGKITLESLFTTKRDGSKAFYPINPSNVLVQDVNLDDRKRKEKLQKKVTKK